MKKQFLLIIDFLFLLKQRILKTRPIIRRSILIISDSLFIILSILLISWVKVESSSSLFIIAIALGIGIPIYSFTGQYKGLSRYISGSSIYKIGVRNFSLVLVLSFILKILSLNYFTITELILLTFLITSFSGMLRLSLRDYL